MERKRIGLIALLVGGLLLSSGIAAAAEDEDTAFNYGYDQANHLLVINTSEFDAEAEEAQCLLDTTEDGTGTEYDLTYTAFDPIALGDLTTEDGATCGMEAAEVTGPNGQVNHGMFMKAFKDLYDGARRGCVNRHLAQSDLGKDDQQILTSEAEEEFEPETSDSTAVFFTALADCEKGDDGDVGALSNGKGKGKGRPDSPGKSASAPGHDR